MKANGLYKLTPVEDPNKPNTVRASYFVTTIDSFSTFYCNCKMFEFCGMLCAHVKKVLIHFKIHQIPFIYILKRWTKKAKDGYVEVVMAKDTIAGTSSSKTSRFNVFCRKMLKLASEGSSSEDIYELAVKHMDKALVEIMEMKANIAKSSYLEQGLLE